MRDSIYDSVFYHIYPLGLCGAPARNDFCSPVTPRLETLHEWLPHLKTLGVNALYLGPLFEASAHGYDTADYFRVDRRLGDNDTLHHLISTFHRNNIRVILDGVFHHAGRDFWAFRDVRQHGRHSAYSNWFHGLVFNGHRSPYNDPFTYEGWNGHYDLVKLNLKNPAVKDHLFQAIAMWIREFDIDGLRLDVADCIEPDFLKELTAFCRSIRPGFWLMGEVIHGDYRTWANSETLDSVTNYECYKGLYSSHVDKNYFEIAYALNRQFGEHGLYRKLPLYAFVDNHDVNRVASNLTNPAHIYPLYCLLFAMPGVPSIYYGSEWGLEGKRLSNDDTPLRPCLDLASVSQTAPHADLVNTIATLSRIRLNSEALKHGTYRQLFVSHEQFAFARQTPDECVVVALNASDVPASVDISLPGYDGGRLDDLLNKGDSFQISGGNAHIDSVWPCWARILKVQTM